MYNLVAAHDRAYGIGCNGALPWYFRKDLKYFSRLTQSGKRNIVVMGRNTWESIPKRYRPLPGRTNVIVSSTLHAKVASGEWCPTEGIHVCPTFDEMLLCIEDIKSKATKVWFIGGQRIYGEALQRGIIGKLYLTHVHGIFTDCDTFLDSSKIHEFCLKSSSAVVDQDIMQTTSSGGHPRYVLSYRELHFTTEETQYLDLLEQVIENGEIRKDRTGVGTKSIFGASMRFSLRNNAFPLFTTKRVYWKGIVEELLWILRGSTDAKELQARNVHIWDGNSSRTFLDQNGLSHLKQGDCGAIYGHQWRHFGAQYVDCSTDYSGKGFDQIQYVIDQIRNNPNSRRIFLSGWNPGDFNIQCLPVCHVSYCFSVRKRELHCHLYMRGNDLGCGCPFNIASAALLTRMLAHITGLKPGELVYSCSDAHIYLNHIEGIQKQIQRVPRLFPTLTLDQSITQLEDFTFDSFTLHGYHPHPRIKLEMAV